MAKRRAGDHVRVAVTGATGNLGTSVLAALCDDPAVEQIVGVARRRPPKSMEKVRWVSADVATDNLAAAFAGADVVIHLAWLIQPSRDPHMTWSANVIGSWRVFEAAAAAGVRAIAYSSSVGAYSPGPKDHPVDESWPANGVPTATYSREKAYVERILDAFEMRNPEIRVVRLRPGFVFNGLRRAGSGGCSPGPSCRIRCYVQS